MEPAQRYAGPGKSTRPDGRDQHPGETEVKLPTIPASTVLAAMCTVRFSSGDFFTRNPLVATAMPTLSSEFEDKYQDDVPERCHQCKRFYDRLPNSAFSILCPA